MNPESRDPDADLVRACRDPDDDGFEEAFEQLYKRYRDRAYAIAYRITGNTVDAMDAVQESFSVLFRKVAAFRFDSAFSTWLFRLVYNCSIDVVRARAARSRPTSLELVDEGQTPVSDQPSPASSAVRGELGEMVHAALQKLSPKLRGVLSLRYLEGMSYEDLQFTLGVSMGTVKSRLARAHLALEGVLRDDPALRSHFETEDVA